MEKIGKSITHSLSRSPSLFDLPGTEAYRYGKYYANQMSEIKF